MAERARLSEECSWTVLDILWNLKVNGTSTGATIRRNLKKVPSGGQSSITQMGQTRVWLYNNIESIVVNRLSIYRKGEAKKEPTNQSCQRTSDVASECCVPRYKYLRAALAPVLVGQVPLLVVLVVDDDGNPP